MLLLLAACAIENQVVEPRGPAIAPLPNRPAEDLPEYRMSVDVAFQQGNWGQQVQRCQIQVAFQTVAETDEVPASSGRPVIEMPSQDGECAYTWLGTDEGGGPDNWQESGSLVGPERMWLHSRLQTLELERVDLDDGQVRYEWLDCSEETFPFGEVFDLDVPGVEGSDIPGFYVGEAFGVGPALDLYAPVPVEGDKLVHVWGDPLYTAWDHLGDTPEVRGAPVPVSSGIYVRNYESPDPDAGPQPSQEFEALGCRPDGDRLHIDAEHVLELEPNVTESDVDAELYTSFQVDVQYESPSIELPWGQTLAIRSTVTDGGLVHLWGEPG